MSRTCKIKGCRPYPEFSVSYFRFPLKNQEMMNKWLESGLEIGKVSRHSKICSKHFSPDDYHLDFRGKRFLKSHAIPKTVDKMKPVVYDPNTMQLVDSLEVMEDKSKLPMISERMKLSMGRMLNAAVQTEPRFLGITEREKSLQLEVRALKSRVKRLCTKIKNAENLMLHLNQTEKCIDAIEKGPLTGVSEFNLEILKNEQYNQGLSNNHKTYTNEIKEFSWTLFNYSPEAYEFVRSKINLPHIDTLKKWQNSLTEEDE